MLYLWNRIEVVLLWFSAGIRCRRIDGNSVSDDSGRAEQSCSVRFSVCAPSESVWAKTKKTRKDRACENLKETE